MTRLPHRLAREADALRADGRDAEDPRAVAAEIAAYARLDTHEERCIADGLCVELSGPATGWAAGTCSCVSCRYHDAERTRLVDLAEDHSDCEQCTGYSDYDDVTDPHGILALLDELEDPLAAFLYAESKRTEAEWSLEATKETT